MVGEHEQFASPRCGGPNLGCHGISTLLLHMARTRSFDGSFDDLPVSMQRAANVDRSFYSDAACRNEVRGTPKIAWTVAPGRKHRVGGNIYDADKLIELALLVCGMCPVQWQCAAAAIEADESAGTWADSLDNIRALSRRPNWRVELELAQSTGVSVQLLNRKQARLRYT